MKQKNRKLSVGVFLILLLNLQTGALALGANDGPLIAIGAGISSPSLISTNYNPAGYISNTRSKLVGLGSFNTYAGAKNPQSYGGGFFSGNGKVGGGVHYTRYQTSNSSSIQPGIAFEAPSIHTSFGLVCSVQTLSYSLSCNDFGLLFDPKRGFRLGAEIITSSSTPIVSGGMAVELNKTITLAVDAVENFTYKTTTLTPGIGVDAQNFEFMASYTKTLSSNSSGSYLFGFGWHVHKDFKFVAYSDLSNSHRAMIIIGL